MLWFYLLIRWGWVFILTNDWWHKNCSSTKMLLFNLWLFAIFSLCDQWGQYFNMDRHERAIQNIFIWIEINGIAIKIYWCFHDNLLPIFNSWQEGFCIGEQSCVNMPWIMSALTIKSCLTNLGDFDCSTSEKVIIGAWMELEKT